MNEYEQVIKQIDDLYEFPAFTNPNGDSGYPAGYVSGAQHALAAIKDFCQKKINASIRNK
jgi:hypothetical protein